jgi:hypothetical protein
MKGTSSREEKRKRCWGEKKEQERKSRKEMGKLWHPLLVEFLNMPISRTVVSWRPIRFAHCRLSFVRILRGQEKAPTGYLASSQGPEGRRKL